MHKRAVALAVATPFIVCAVWWSGATPVQAFQKEASPGQLTIVGKDGKVGELCPLSKTTVNADISGFGARVTMVQTFTNPSRDTIEAIYTFPLPPDAAVDRMRMKIGSRVINGQIKRKEEARQIYEAAKNAGQVASLLDQERPNIFTQSVANITPGATIEIEISYVQVLKYEDGQFEFNFPMVVGPRNLMAAPDPQKIAPPTAATRTGTNIELNVRVNAGAPIQEIKSVLHEVNINQPGRGLAMVSLKNSDEIPNRDFILKYRVATGTVTSSLLTYASSQQGGYFTLILMPPKAPTEDQISPKEMIFVMDQSGSQNGFPIEKSKELTKKLIETMGPDDTFNVIGFSTQVNALWPQTMRNTPENRTEAIAFVSALEANGGTDIVRPALVALTPPKDPERLRIVMFNTDGFIGNDFDVLDTIQKNLGDARLFTFGIGNSVNRFLIDAMASEGKGDAEYQTLAETADAAVERFVRRVQHPVLTDIDVKFDGLQVTDVLPKRIPDVFSEKPVIIMGRYTQPGSGRIAIAGHLGKGPWSNSINAAFPAVDKDGSAIATLWARAQVDELMRQDWRSHTHGDQTDVKEKIINLALDYGIMTQYTSFVAVEQKVVNVGGRQRTVQVPVEKADGVRYDMDSGLVAFDKSDNSIVTGSLGGFGGGYSTGRAATKRATLSGGAPATAGKVSAGVGYVEQKDELNKAGEVKPDPKKLRESRYESVVAKTLRDAKAGAVEVQIWLKEWKMSDIQKLKKLGFTLDSKDERLKVLFGRVDATKLIELAQIESVSQIRPLK